VHSVDAQPEDVQSVDAQSVNVQAVDYSLWMYRLVFSVFTVLYCGSVCESINLHF
jgi:hypothetical protein